MTFSITSFVRTYCLCAFFLFAALAAQGKEKIETPNKRTEGARSRSIPTLHIPWVSPHHPLLSKPSLPLSLDPIRFTLQADKPTVAEGEEVEITITAQLLDIPASAFFIFEEQKSFSIKLLLPQGFTQTGGDYQEYIGAQLSSQNKTFTKRIRGIFTSIPENPCFALLRGAYHANASSVFEQKQVLCLIKKEFPKATRVADCTAPVLTPITAQTICYGGGFYMVSTSVTNGVEVYYQWYNDNGAANNNTNPIAGEERANLRSFPTAPGVYKYKIVATSSAGSSCSASQSVTLTVNAPPTITSTAGTNPSCAPIFGGTISVVGAGGSALMYSKDDGGNWVDLTGLNAQNEITRNTILYTTENDVAKVKITLEEGFGLGPGGEYKGEIRNETTTPVFDGLAAGTYKIRVKNENGCISEPTPVTLTNPNAPAIFNVTGGGTCVAGGAAINLSGSSTGVNYSLLRNGVTVTGGVAGTGNALSFGNHTTEGTYTVTATNTTTNCSAVMTNSVVVSNAPPAAPIIDAATTVVCAGQSAVLTTNSSCAGTLVWTPSGGTLTNNNHTYTVAPTTATTYTAKCQINSCISDISNSIQLTVTTLSAPVIAGVSPRALCPDSTVMLVATGCSSTVAWSYTLSSGATGTLASTNDTLSLTFAGAGISTWNAGDTLSLRAACTTLTCTSQPSTAVKVVKEASCVISPAMADCAFYIKAADAQGTETLKLTRTGAGAATFQPLTLSAMTLDSTSLTGVTLSWTGPGITTPLTTAQISATLVGEYKVVLTPTSGSAGPCELYITLSGTPCTIPASATCGVPVSITPSDQGGPYLTALAPGDQFTANDYVITVTSVTSSTAGAFVGEGYARMKLTNGFSIDVPVVFGQVNGSGSTTTATPIKLNTCYQLVDGTVFTQYDPSWGNIVDVDVLAEVLTEDVTGILSDFDNVIKDNQAIDPSQGNDLLQRLNQFEANAISSPFMIGEDLTAFNQAAQCAATSLEEAINAAGGGSANGGRIGVAESTTAAQARECYITMVEEFFKAIKKYLQRCESENWVPYDNNSIVPKCLWLNTIPAQLYTMDPAFTAGVIDGAYATLKDAGEVVYTIADLNSCVSLTNTSGGLRYLYDEAFANDCKKKFTQLLEPIGAIKDLVVNTSLDEAWKGLKSAVGEYVEQTVCSDDLCRYRQGKLVFEVASAFIPVGGILKGGLKAAKLAEVLKAVDAVSDQIKIINRAINGVKGKLVKTATRGVASMLSEGGTIIATVSNGVIEPIAGLITTDATKRVVKRLNKVKYRLNNGTVIEGDLELVDGGGCDNLRVGAENGVAACNLIWRLVSRVTPYFATPKQWWDYLNDPVNATLKAKWERYLKPYNRVDLNTLGKKDELSSILTEFKKSHLCFDSWGFPDFLSFTKTFHGVVSMIPIDMKGNNVSDYSDANKELVKRLNAATGTQTYPANFEFNGFNKFEDGITYTWHHHQDGKHMLLVPSTLNHKNPSQLSHLGGRTLVLNNFKLSFPAPTKFNCN